MNLRTHDLALALGLTFCPAAFGCGAEPSASEECNVETGTLCTIIGTGTAGFNGDGKTPRATEIYLPMDVGRGPDGLLYFIDWNNHRIRVIEDGKVRTIAGTGELGDGPEGDATKADFNHPTSFTFDALGRMVVAAWHNSRIKRIDLTTGELEDMCGTGKRAYSGDEGPAEVADLDLPASVAFDSEGTLFIMDQANQTIRSIDAEGTIRRFAGQCITNTCADGEEPVACEGTNKFACLESDAMACQKPCALGFDGDGGPALEARFSQPFGQSADPAGHLVFDQEGNLYLSDTGNHRIRRIGRDGVIETVVGTGEPGYGGDGKSALKAKLQRPVDLEFDSQGTLYIADTYNSCVRAVDKKGAIRTVAGKCGERGYTADSGVATELLLNRPYGLTVDGDQLYITDTYNHRVVVVGL